MSSAAVWLIRSFTSVVTFWASTEDTAKATMRERSMGKHSWQTPEERAPKLSVGLKSFEVLWLRIEPSLASETRERRTRRTLESTAVTLTPTLQRVGQSFSICRALPLCLMIVDHGRPLTSSPQQTHERTHQRKACQVPKDKESGTRHRTLEVPRSSIHPANANGGSWILPARSC